MRIFLPLLAEKFGKTPKHGGFFQNLDVLAKSTIFRVFSRNEELFATFGWKVRQNAKTRWFLRKVSSLGQIDHFSCFSAKFATFCEYWLKRSSKRRNTVVASKSWKFWPYRRFFVFFREMRHLLPLLAEKFVKTPKNGGFFEKVGSLAKSTIFPFLLRNEALFATFGWKVRENAETRWFLLNVASFRRIDNFSCFFAKWGTFCNFCLKRSSKRRNAVVSSKTCKFSQNRRFFVFLYEMRHFLPLFGEKFVKNAETRWFLRKSSKFWPNRRFLPFFREMRPFFRLLCEMFVKTPKHGGFFEKVASFGQIDNFSPFFAKWGTFCHFWPKSSSKRRNTVVFSNSVQFLPNQRVVVFLREMSKFLRILAEKFVKTTKHCGCFEKFEVLAKSTSCRVFARNEALFATSVWKVRQNAETPWFLR